MRRYGGRHLNKCSEGMQTHLKCSGKLNEIAVVTFSLNTVIILKCTFKEKELQTGQSAGTHLTLTWTRRGGVNAENGVVVSVFKPHSFGLCLKEETSP
jgi:hypothetical protein